VEEPLYLTDPADAATAIALVPHPARPRRPLSILLRPGALDTPPSPHPRHPPEPLPPAPAPPAPSPRRHPASCGARPTRLSPLRDKAQLARAHNCAELNFYAYGLYRVQALDHIRHALSAA
jgi:hypothetical protein